MPLRSLSLLHLKSLMLHREKERQLDGQNLVNTLLFGECDENGSFIMTSHRLILRPKSKTYNRWYFHNWKRGWSVHHCEQNSCFSDKWMICEFISLFCNDLIIFGNQINYWIPFSALLISAREDVDWKGCVQSSNEFSVLNIEILWSKFVYNKEPSHQTEGVPHDATFINVVQEFEHFFKFKLI